MKGDCPGPTQGATEGSYFTLDGSAHPPTESKTSPKGGTLDLGKKTHTLKDLYLISLQHSVR